MAINGLLVGAEWAIGTISLGEPVRIGLGAVEAPTDATPLEGREVQVVQIGGQRAYVTVWGIIGKKRAQSVDVP